jgi:hypothetical protein
MILDIYQYMDESLHFQSEVLIGFEQSPFKNYLYRKKTSQVMSKNRLIEVLIDKGLRAQIRTDHSQGLNYINIEFFPDSAPASLLKNKNKYFIIPSVPFKKAEELERLPLEELTFKAIDFLRYTVPRINEIIDVITSKLQEKDQIKQD